MNTLQVGTIETVIVDRKNDTGYVLQKDNEEVFLHHNETVVELEVEDEVDVFLYLDKKGNLLATTKLPSIVMNEYDWAIVKETVPNLGVFVDIGTTKEILVSKDDLPLFEHIWPIEGDKLFVTLGTDRKGRLLAIPATESVIEKRMELAPEELLNKEIAGTVYRTNREGAAIYTDFGYRGFIHHTERKEEPRLGEYVKGRIIDVKQDGTLNISLRPLKKYSRLEDADAILKQLQENNGVIPFSDKSDPDDIRGTFNISKASFKRALGKLMKDGKVEQKNGKTYLR